MLDLLFQRRSIRMYKRVPIERESVERLEKAALLAPSSKGLNSSRVVAVTDADTLGLLSMTKAHGAHFLAGAPMGFVIMADRSVSDVWVEDASVMATCVQLEAEKLGLGSCWIQIRNRSNAAGLSSEDQVRGILGIPERFGVVCILAIGYPAETKPPRTEDELDMSRIRCERYDEGEGTP